MKTIAITASSAEIQRLLNDARAEDVLLRTPDGTEYLLTVVDDFEREVALTRQNRKLMALLEERARQPASISLSELKAELGLD